MGNNIVKSDTVDGELLDAFVQGVQNKQKAAKEPSPEEKVEAAMAHLLGELGRQRVKEDELLFQGTKFILPAQYDGNVLAAIQFLDSWRKNQAKKHTFNRVFKYRPFDVAYAFLEVMKELTGTQGLGVSKFTFFGEEPPQFVTINIGPNKTAQVPWGHILFPMFEAEFNVQMTQDEDYGFVGLISVSAPKRNQAIMEGVFTLVERYLKEHSLYRGKAISGSSDNPEFIDLSTVDPKKVVYSQNVLAQLEANVWAPIRFTDAYRDQKVSIKRAVLFAGPYGTGKTLGCMLTAQEAVEHGWTFIQCRTGKDDPAIVMKTAELYAPAVVVVEDFDANLGTASAVDISRLLELLDGATNKGKEIIGLFTTNHIERIQKGALRPGRIDAIVEIDGLDQEAFQRLITITLGEEWIEKKVDWAAVATAFDGFLPAFVKEAAERAQRYTMARNHGQPGVIKTADLVAAAEGLRPQLDLMSGAKEGMRSDTLSEGIAKVVEGVVTRTNIPDFGNAKLAVEPATLLNGAKQA